MGKFPKVIEKMIISRWKKAWSAERIAKSINGSKTAEKLNVSYTTRSISAKLANLTRS